MAEWTISVSQLNDYVRKMISGDPMLRSIRIRGEISGLKRPVSGHIYFTLKDEGARVQCVMFKQQAQFLCVQPVDGMQVVAVASASLYAPNGTYQLYVESITQEGAGELYLRFEALKAKLSAEGLFDPSLKKPLPLLPKTIGVVTSRSGAVLRDIVRVAGRRNPHVHVILAAASVQGSGAAAEIASALDRLNADGRADVILCGRGGGSMEDLWPFNEEIVARAIARSKIPVVSCVGHETDFTIADFVADVRASTPSAAAETVVPMLDELTGTVDALVARLLRALMNRQELNRARLARLSASPALVDPRRMLIGERERTLSNLREKLERGLIRTQEQKRASLRMWSARLSSARFLLHNDGRRKSVDALSARMDRALERRLREQNAQVDALCRMLDSLNPANVLERGYAAVYVNGKAVSDAAAVPDDKPIDVRMRDGRLAAQVVARRFEPIDREDTEHGKETDL